MGKPTGWGENRKGDYWRASPFDKEKAGEMWSADQKLLGHLHTCKTHGKSNWSDLVCKFLPRGNSFEI